ncbi:MAG: UDP-3-O-acyl-N-acetylglucosamine deacetylase [Kiritimatiellia bacterium]
MSEYPHGKILSGDKNGLKSAHEQFSAIPVDLESHPQFGTSPYSELQTTLSAPVQVTGPGTFLGKARRTLCFEPTGLKGWWLDRSDLPDSMPIRVSVNNVWTTVRNIVLSSGSPHNYMRMVEHIAALKTGLGLDNVMIRMDSGDPPLFDRSSADMVEAIEKSGIVTGVDPAVYYTVSEPVTVCGPGNSFLTFLPAAPGDRKLLVDCAVDFRSAIGKQRVRFTVSRDSFRKASTARTNTTFWVMLYCRTIGKIFADVRNLGYTPGNILIVGRNRYINRPRLLNSGKSLEAVWHRATLDLLAAVALIDRGRFAGTIVSYKAGHTLDVTMITELYRRGLLVQHTR